MQTTVTATTAAEAVFGGPVMAVSTVELTLRMGVALAVVLTILMVGTSLIRRRGGRGAARVVTIEHQQQLTKHTTLTLLTAGQQQLLIASNSNETTLLAQGPTLLTPATASNSTANSAVNPAGSSEASIDIRTGAPATAQTQPAVAAGARARTVKPKRQNPLKQLQNKTVRRA